MRISSIAALPLKSMRLRHQAVLRLAALTPAPLARRISALQFRLPALQRMIASAAAGLVGERVVISGGAAEGLTIAALDTNLGYRIGTTEPALQQFLVNTLAPGDVFYDVGANVGFFSLIGCRLVGSSGHVVALEPLSAAAELLRENLEANGFGQAIAVEAAIGAVHGRGTLELGRSSLDGRLSSGSDGPTVEIVSIDHGVEALGWPLPSVIKLDVEGAEVSAIEGMRRTVALCRPILLIEVHWCRDAVLDALAALDYVGEPFGDVDLLAANNEVQGMLLARSSAYGSDSCRMTHSPSHPVDISETAISLSVDRMSAEVVRALDAAGIRTVLLKGPATLHRLYDPGEHRPYVDCDLLIEAAAEPAAVSVLRQLGFSPDPGFGSPDPGIADQHGWHRNGDHVDLHSSLWGVRAPADAVWPALTERAEVLTVGGHRMRVLGAGGLALLLTLHAASDGPAGQKPLEDLQRGLVRLGNAPWEEAAQLARRLDALAAFGAGLKLVPDGPALITSLGIDPGYDIEVALRASGAPTLAGSIERVRREPTFSGKLRRIRRTLLPTPTYMRRWSPWASQGPFGMALAYLWRPVWLVLQAGPGLRAWLRARRAESRSRR